jgi:hypothetical protein
VQQVDDVKKELHRLLGVHDDAEFFRDFGGDPPSIREHIEREIARIYTQVMGVHPQKRRRLALAQRLDRLAARKLEANHDPALARLLAASAIKGKSVPADLLGDPFDEISDAELAPVAAVWNSGPGAKSDGAVSKWVALSRVLSKYGDNTRPSTLEKETRSARRAREARRAARNRG